MLNLQSFEQFRYTFPTTEAPVNYGVLYLTPIIVKKKK